MSVSNNETKKYLEKLNAEIFFKGNLKLTNEIDKDKINNINEKFLWLKDFGSQRAFTEKKYFV